MSGRGRPSKRKLEEQQGQRKGSKEARTESITVEVTEAAHLTLCTLTQDDFMHIDIPEDRNEVVEEVEEDGGDGRVSRGLMWRGPSKRGQETATPQITLGCERSSSGENFDCATQTFHFTPSELPQPPPGPIDSTQDPSRPKKTSLPGISLESIKVEIDGEQDYLNRPLVCCVVGCGARPDSSSDRSEGRNSTTLQQTIFYALPHTQQDRDAWAASIDIKLSEDGRERERHICSRHFLTPAKLIPAPPPHKTKTRKKKTCDMLIAEEAERIRQGLSGGRPKRIPKPNKNYNWAEIVPLIKAEPDELDELDFDLPSQPLEQLPSARRRKQALHSSVKQEEKENEAPDREMWTKGEDEDGEWEEYGPDVSLPSHPRPPPPKPKGRPHRIRDNCCQTEAPRSTHRQPLREVRVQCGLPAAQASQTSCPTCSYVDWQRLEDLLVAVIKGSERGEFGWDDVQECVGVVLEAAAPYPPSHPTNVLKLLRGEEREELESASGIVLVSSHQGEEVEIENVIHPEVEEPITGEREITPRIWSSGKTHKLQLPEVIKSVDHDDDLEEDDRLGLEEATEKDEEEFQPGLGVEEDEEDDDDIEEVEEEEEVDDEDWDVKKGDDSKPKKKRKKLHKPKKELMLVDREAGVSNKTDVEGKGSVTCNTQFKGIAKCKDRAEPILKNKASKQECGSVRRRIRKERQGSKETKQESVEVEREGHRCDRCGKVFVSESEAKEHDNEHQLESQYPCQDCGETFSRKLGLNVHRMFQHGAGRVYQCDHCDYEASRLYHLKRHARVHTGERAFICSVCRKGLKSAQALQNHIVLHTNMGRFSCEVCQKAFNQRRAWEDHCSSHRGDRQYSCRYCDATFKTYKHVACHIRAIHLCDKRFLCDVCGARHMTGANLKSHMKTHRQAQVLPFAFRCHICEESFRGAKGLSAHIAVVHEPPNLGQERRVNSKEPVLGQASGKEKREEKSEKKRVVTLHPTRRPRKIEYGLLVREEVKNVINLEKEDAREEEREDQQKESSKGSKPKKQQWDLSQVREMEEEEDNPEEREGSCTEEGGNQMLLVKGENFVCHVKMDDIEFEF